MLASPDDTAHLEHHRRLRRQSERRRVGGLRYPFGLHQRSRHQRRHRRLPPRRQRLTPTPTPSPTQTATPSPTATRTPTPTPRRANPRPERDADTDVDGNADPYRPADTDRQLLRQLDQRRRIRWRSAGIDRRDSDRRRTPTVRHFHNTTTGGSGNCDWDFGDGTNASIVLVRQHRQPQYSTRGTYNVTLSVQGTSVTRSNYVYITCKVPAFAGVRKNSRGGDLGRPPGSRQQPVLPVAARATTRSATSRSPAGWSTRRAAARRNDHGRAMRRDLRRRSRTSRHARPGTGRVRDRAADHRLRRSRPA